MLNFNQQRPPQHRKSPRCCSCSTRQSAKWRITRPTEGLQEDFNNQSTNVGEIRPTIPKRGCEEHHPRNIQYQSIRAHREQYPHTDKSIEASVHRPRGAMGATTTEASNGPDVEDNRVIASWKSPSNTRHQWDYFRA